MVLHRRLVLVRDQALIVSRAVVEDAVNRLAWRTTTRRLPSPLRRMTHAVAFPLLGMHSALMSKELDDLYVSSMPGSSRYLGS